MLNRICFAYLWATTGGVERVFLSRSEVLLREYPHLEIDVYFYEDGGGGAFFRQYKEKRRLGSRFNVVRTFEPSRYDLVFCVDTPRILCDYPRGCRYVVECHTPYAPQRAYLQHWQHTLDMLIVPSTEFRTLVESECPALTGKVKVVRNFVPAHSPRSVPTPPAWPEPLFFYFGRMDGNKNLGEFVQALSYSRRYLRKPAFGVLCGPVASNYGLPEIIAEHDMKGSIVLLPPVPFDRVEDLLEVMKQRRGIFVSCSKGESFGLSAAEAMEAGVPVILSAISSHSALVGGRDRFLYRLGSPGELAVKMSEIEQAYDERANECRELARSFSEEAFLRDWKDIFSGASAFCQSEALASTLA